MWVYLQHVCHASTSGSRLVQGGGPSSGCGFDFKETDSRLSDSRQCASVYTEGELALESYLPPYYEKIGLLSGIN